ncbi:transglycosylase domain-containing protein [Streptomyces sp. MB09-02B]|uniref:transglycosylase domain-containing protein n=1 Tax=Streptomyces sp. MB09-02B TaxID=3028667 RepID=UPI0029B4D3F1|nr:transglycosylase domain-containing protein [Streptomyces sp. MB09-02B]MDX3641549.1 transglycosylase domain-containing protein [Streptomyces sp. MB09-02B]
MGRAEERRARQRGGRRAAPQRSSGGDAGATAVIAPPEGGGRAAARAAAKAGGKKQQKSQKSFLRRLFTWKKILGTFFGVCLLGMGAFIVLYLMIDIPKGNPEATQESNVYKFSNGKIFARTGDTNREIVELDKVPEKVQMAFVAAENKTFYSDPGVDFKGMTRGVINTLSGKGKQGGSTITQQYVKNYYLTSDQTVTRKLNELVISLKLEREESKDYILAGYINTSFYGRQAWGIQAAAQAYYRKDAKDLTVEEGAYLAALLQAPSQYDLATATPTGRKLVTARWNYVLDNMVEMKELSASERADMKLPKPKAPQAAAGMAGQNGYLVEAANNQLAKQLVASGKADDTEDAKALIELRGWTITLNINPKKQAALEKAVKERLTSKLDPKKRKVDKHIQAGAVSVDPKTGKVVAMYGGVNFVEHFTNNATRRDYQPASTFKPVILAAAVDEDAETQDGDPITANTIYDGDSRHKVTDNGTAVGFAPPNEDNVDYDDVTVQTAMNKSINSVFAQMGVDVGMEKVMEVAGKLGMDTEGMEAVPAQTLGSMGASPLEMAGIYATLDNHGKKVTPTIIAEAKRRDEEVKFDDPIGEQVITREAADTVTSVLTGVVDDGTAKVSVRENPARNGQTVAGKTGTSDKNRSAWFTGYTPNLVTSVGLFGEDMSKNGKHVPMYGAVGVPRVNGGGFPAQIWATYTFGVMGKTAKFDLETKQGAAVAPTESPTPSQTPSATPSETPSATPSETPSSEEPSSEPATTPETTPEETPSTTPEETPSGDAGGIDFPTNPNDPQVDD